MDTKHTPTPVNPYWDKIDELRPFAETGEQWAELCRLEGLARKEDFLNAQRVIQDLVEINRRDELTDPAQVATDWWRKDVWDRARALAKAEGK